jgi:plasmid stability protein
MPAILIRNIPEPVQDTLRSIAAERHVSVEALVRETLSAFVDRSPAAPIFRINSGIVLR